MVTTRKKPVDGVHDDTTMAEGVGNLWDVARPASQLAQLSKLKALVYGPSGAGKTRLMSLFRRPLIGMTELQGVPTVQQWNPDALVYPIPDAEALKGFRRLVADPDLPNRVDAVCIDSVTDLQRIIKAAYVAKQASARELPDMDTWGLIVERTARMVREVRDLPVHVVVSCLDMEQTIAGEGTVHRPAVQGRTLPSDLAQYFNLVGYAYTRQHERGVRHEVMFRGSERYMTKAMPGIDDVESPEPAMWISKRFGGDVTDDVRKRHDEWLAMAGESNTNNNATRNTQSPTNADVDPFGNPK